VGKEIPNAASRVPALDGEGDGHFEKGLLTQKTPQLWACSLKIQVVPKHDSPILAVPFVSRPEPEGSQLDWPNGAGIGS
jgi:hypothetical protein